MAYNSNKGPQHTGDLQYEGDPSDVQIDFENDQIILKTGGAPRVSVVNTQMSASGIFRNVGAISGSGDLAVSGAIHATTFYGSGAGLTSVAATTVTIANDADTRMITAGGDGTLTGESTLTFDGSNSILTIANGTLKTANVSGSNTITAVGSISSSADVAVSGAIHATAFYGSGAGLTSLPTATSLSGTTAQLTTGVETSGYLKVTGSSTLADATTTTLSSSGFSADSVTAASAQVTINFNVGTSGQFAPIGNAYIYNIGYYSGSGGFHNVSSMSSSGDLAVTGAVHATTFYGSGAGLTSLPTATSLSGTTAQLTTGVETSGYLKVTGSSTFAGDVTIDKDHSDTTAATITGLQVDFDKTGTSTSNNTMYGINIDMDNTTATDGLNTMYGLHVTPTLTHAAAAGVPVVYGALINAQGGTNGTSIVQAARFEAGGGDLNYGIQLDVEDGGVDLRIESSADSGDYFQIQTTTAGASTITTVDDGGAAAHLTFNVDGNITLDPVGGNVVIDGNVSGSGTLYSAGSISGSGDIAVTGAVHAAQFYGGGAGLTGVTAGAPTSLSGTTAQLTTGVETSGYLKVSGSTTLRGPISSSAGLMLMGAGEFGTNIFASGSVSASAGITAGSSISSSGDLAVTGAVHAATFYGSGTGLTGITVSALSGTTAQLTTGVETSGYLKVSGSSTFDTITVAGTSGGEGAIFEQGLTIKNADASAGFINFYEQSSNGTNVCTFRGKSAMGNCTITLPGDTGTVVLEDNTVTLSNKTIASPTITGQITGSLSGSADIAVSGAIHAANFYGDGSGLTNVTAGAPTSLSGTTAQLTTGVETSGYLKVTGSSTLAGVTATTISASSTLQVVGGTILGNSLNVSGTTVVEALIANGITNASTYSGSSTLVTVGSISSSADVAVTGAIHAASFYGDGSNLTGISAGNVSGSARVYTVTGLETSGYLKVTGSSTLGAVTATTVSASSTMEAVGATTLGSTLAVSGTVTVAGDIVHAGDSDTYLRFEPNLVNLVAGGLSAIKLETSTGKIQLNNGNDDLDVQVMADNGAVILHADAATNKLGINTDAPAEALSVVGNISGSGTTRLVGSISGSTDLAVSGAIHAANFYGDGSGLTNVTAGAPTSLSGTTAQLTTGVETSGYLKVTGSSTLAGVTATTISASSTLQVVGNAVLGGNTNVSGNIVLQTTDPTIYFSSSAGAALGQMGYNSSANILIQNDTVNKHIVLKANDNGTIKEGLRLDGAVPEVVVNQNGASGDNNTLVDFRVESDDNTHMLFVDGGENKVGINTDTPSEVLTIVGNISGSGTARLVGSISGSGDIAVSGAIHAANFYGDGSGLTNVTAGAPTSLSGTIAQLTTGVETSGYLKVTGSSTLGATTMTGTGSVSDIVASGSISGSSTLEAIGATTLGATLAVSGTVSVAQKIEHAGDTDTYIEFTPDSMAVVVGAEQMIVAIEGGGGSQADKVTINNGNQDIDFQVKGSSVPNLIRTDAANNKVGIGMADATFASHTLTVVGTFSGSSTLVAVGSISSSADIAVSGAIHATTFYGSGAGLTSLPLQTTLSGTTAQLTTGVETSGYLKVSGSTTLAGPTAVAAPLTLTAPLSSSATVHVVGATSMEGTLTLSSSVTAVGLYSTAIISGSNGLHIDSATSLGGTLNVTGTVGIGTSTAQTALDVHHNPTVLDNDTGGGDVVQFGTGTTTAGKLYYLHSGSSWQQAAGVGELSGGLGMLAVALGTTPGTHGMLIRGFYDVHSYLSGAFVAGTTLYISAPGYMTTMRPSGSTEILRVLGTCTTTANVIYFNPSPDYLVIT